MTSKSTIGPKGQITIPKEFREKYHLHEGEEVLLVPVHEGLIVKHPPSSLRGRLRGMIDLKGFEKDLQEIRKQWKV
jgi:AbrB family looped-hinge helix DNA binding protein